MDENRILLGVLSLKSIIRSVKEQDKNANTLEAELLLSLLSELYSECLLLTRLNEDLEGRLVALSWASGVR